MAAGESSGWCCSRVIIAEPTVKWLVNVGVERMKYYLQYKRSAEQFYRTHGSLNTAREVMEVLRTGRQLDSNLHYIWARCQSSPANPDWQSVQPTTIRSPDPEIA
jgi:hypothetical protein